MVPILIQPPGTIYNRWVEENKESGRATGSRQIDIRTAIIEHFRDQADIMLATEAAAEGVNLQFCSLVINYDLPWNPQRIEQRIGRCHRYGQKHDVVVINFLNERNAADQRVYELLNIKFSLFSGVFGVSDDVLGAIESGIDFEKRIHQIYQQCRTPEEIDLAFKKLQAEVSDKIQAKQADTRKILLDNFDEEVHQRLGVNLSGANEELDLIGEMFWRLSKHVLANHARFQDSALSFILSEPGLDGNKPGTYHLITKKTPAIPGDFLYRLSHPLGEHVIKTAKALAVPSAEVEFDITGRRVRIRMIEELKNLAGWLILRWLEIDSFEREEYLLFSAFTDGGQALNQETCEKLFRCFGAWKPIEDVPAAAAEQLRLEAERHTQATVAKSLDENNMHLREAQERLDKWADDMEVSAQKKLTDTKARIRALESERRKAATVAEQRELQEKILKLEKAKRKQRQEIFDTEDEIAAKRKKMIEALERRLMQRTHAEDLFAIRWRVV